MIDEASTVRPKRKRGIVTRQSQVDHEQQKRATHSPDHEERSRNDCRVNSRLTRYGRRMAVRSWVPLTVVSNYTFLEGASFPEELITQAAAFDLPAMAITDRDGFYGLIRAYAAAKTAGLKLLAGSLVTRTDGPPLTLLAMNLKGYSAISMLVSKGRLQSPKGTSGVDTALIERYCSRNVICVHNDLPREPLLERLTSIFRDRLYAGVARYILPEDEHRVHAVKYLASTHRIPLVAAPMIQFHSPTRKDLSDILSAIRLQCRVDQLLAAHILPNANFTLVHPVVFSRIYHDMPDAVARTVEIADRCTFKVEELKYHYPSEVVPPGRTPDSYLEELTWRLASDRYAGAVPPAVKAQLRHELDLIHELNYSNYFLTMYDIVSYARSLGILCQGRGSAANSAVCYVLGITSVDPVRSNLLFERFISRERNEPPDIDVDFEHERREEVIQYIYQRYGRRRAAMVAEFIRYRTRSSIRDVGKALGFSLPQVTRLSNLASSFCRDSQDWWDKAVVAAGYSPEHPRVKRFHSLVARILGFPRHLSIHTGGFIISDVPVDHLVPIEPARMENRTVIQWDKEDVETAGLLKIDILGLGMLSCLRRSFELLKRHKGLNLDLASIPAEDPETYDMIRQADTVGVFQIESRAQMSMLPRLKPMSFYDLVVGIALVRPGPIQGKMVHPYLRRRQGLEPVSFPLPELEPVLGRTYGVPLFQEQVMKLAMIAAGFSGGEADQLRRAMGAWRKTGCLDGIIDKLIRRMEERGIPPEYACQIADQIRGFGEYGFPESHAASFALLAYASAWLKRHHPEVLAAALINSQPMGFYSPATILEDARRHGVRLLPISVNDSEWECTLSESRDETTQSPLLDPQPAADQPSAKLSTSDFNPRLMRYPRHSLRLGFSLVRSFIREHANLIISRRTTEGPFSSFHDFTRRCPLPVHSLLKLALAGAFSCFGLERRQALWMALSLASQHSSLLPRGNHHTPPSEVVPLSKWETLMADLESTQVYLSAHPFELVYPHMKTRQDYVPSCGICSLPNGTQVTVGGVVIVRQRPPTAGGLLFITLEDHEGFLNLVVPPQVFTRYRQTLLEEPILMAQGRIERVDTVINIKVARVAGIHLAFDHPYLPSRDFR